MAGQTVIQSLLVELDAKTVGLEAKLVTMQQQLDKFQAKAGGSSSNALAGFQKFAEGMIPIPLKIAAVGAALTAVTAKAIGAATAVDTMQRQLAANLPTGNQGIGQLTSEIDAVAEASGRATDEVRAAAVEIAKLGVTGPEEVRQRLTAAAELADATGTDLTSTVQSLDQIMDLFNLSAGQAEQTLANIASAARGRVDIESAFQAFQSAAPKIRELGIDSETATKAIIALLDQGRSGKQIMQAFSTLDADGIRQYAEQAKIAAGALEDLRSRAQDVRDGAEQNTQRLKNSFMKALEDLGQQILPGVIVEMQAATAVVNAFTHATETGATAVQGYLQQLSIVGEHFKAGDLNLKAGDPRMGALGQSMSWLNASFQQGTFDPSTLSPKMAANVRSGLEAYLQLNGLVGKLRGNYQQLLDALDKVAAKQADIASGGTGGGKPGTQSAPLTVQEKQQIESARAAATAAMNSLSDQVSSAITTGTTDGIQKAYDAFQKFSRDAQAKYIELKLQLAKTKLPQSQQDQILDEYASKARATQMAMLGGIDQMISASSQKWQLDMASKIAAITGSASQQLQAELDAMTAEFAKQGRLDDPQVKQLLALKQGAIDAAKAIEDVDKQLTDFRQGAGLEDGSMGVFSTASLKDQLDKLGAMRQELIGVVNEMQKEPGNDQRIKQLRDEIAKVDKTIADLLQQQDNLHQKAYDILHQVWKKVGTIAGDIADVANAAYGIVQAFGAADQQVGKVLASVAQLGGGIQKAASGWSSLDFLGKAGAVGGIVGGALGLANALFGSDPAEQQRIKTLQDNTAAIQKLTEKVGLLGTGLSGSAATAASSALAQYFSAPDHPFLGTDFYDANKIKRKDTGLTQEQLNAIDDAAKALNITLDDTVGSWKQLRDALSASSVKLGEFGADFQSALDQLDASKKIFGDQGPLSDLAQLLGVTAGYSPALKGLLDGLDINKASDLATLRKRVEDLFTTMEAGGQKLSAADLGELTGDQLLQVLEQVIGDLDQIGQQAQSTSDALSSAIAGLEDAQTKLSEMATKDAAASPAIAQLLTGLDLTKAADLSTLQQRIKDLLQTLQSNPDSVDKGTLSIDALIQALVALASGASEVANGIQSAADKISAARNQLSTDFTVFGTDAQGQATGLQQFYAGVSGAIKGAIGGLDLTSDAGRQAAVAALEGLYASNKGDATLVQQIVDLLQAIRAVPASATAAAGAAAAATTRAGNTTGALSVTQQVQQVTEVTAGRMADTLTSMLAVMQSWHGEWLTNVKQLLARLSGTVIPVPQIPAAYLGAGAGKAEYKISLFFSQNFYGEIRADAADLDRLGHDLLDQLNRGLGKALDEAKQLTGNTMRTGA